MSEKDIKRMKAEYEEECAKTAIRARKAFMTVLAREAKGQTKH